jgi:hypothetical protein
MNVFHSFWKLCEVVAPFHCGIRLCFDKRFTESGVKVHSRNLRKRNSSLQNTSLNFEPNQLFLKQKLRKRNSSLQKLSLNFEWSGLFLKQKLTKRRWSLQKPSLNFEWSQLF